MFFTHSVLCCVITTWWTWITKPFVSGAQLTIQVGYPTYPFDWLKHPWTCLVHTYIQYSTAEPKIRVLKYPDKISEQTQKCLDNTAKNSLMPNHNFRYCINGKMKCACKDVQNCVGGLAIKVDMANRTPWLQTNQFRPRFTLMITRFLAACLWKYPCMSTFSA